MKFSVFDPQTGRYFYYSAGETFFVDLLPDYANRPFLPWQEVKIRLPSSAQPCGSGLVPQGMIVHPEELDSPSCKSQTDWVWALVVLGFRWLFF